MKKMISKVNSLLFILLAVSLLAGSLAYFADRVTTQASISTVSNGVDIEPLPDPSVDPDDPTKPDPKDYEDPTPDNPDDDLTNWWAYLNSRAMANYNPGDKMTLNYILKNSGSLAVDVRETFIVTSSKPLSDTPEFRLFTSFTKDSAGANFGDAVVVTEERLDSQHYKYVVAPHILSSDEQTVSGAPVQEAKEYYLVFDALSSNAFQGAKVTVDYVVEAKQHTEDAEDWVTAATGTLTFDGFDLNVVPEA